MVELDMEMTKQLLQQEMYHPYLHENITPPQIDELKLVLLTLVIEHACYTSEKKQPLMIAVSLLQAAQDAQKEVPLITAPSATSEATQERQRRVLASDYYNSLYYALLAELKDHHLIQLLALAVKEVNEANVHLHQQTYGTLTEYVRLKKCAEGLVIVRLAEYLGVGQMSHLVERLIAVDVLLTIKRDVREGAVSALLAESFNDPLHKTPERILETITALLQEEISHLKHELLALPRGARTSHEYLYSLVEEMIDEGFNDESEQFGV